MSFNNGYLMAVKTSADRGGTLKLDFISATGRFRGIEQRGTRAGSGPLPIYNPASPSSRLQYPISQPFSMRGVAVIHFLYDASDFPAELASNAGIYSSKCLYSIQGIPTHNVSNRREFLRHLANINDFGRASPNFTQPHISHSVVDMVIGRARLLAQINNSMSRFCMAGMIVI